MGFGMPAVGVLCNALLQQVKHPEKMDFRLPCSEVVQNLSLMIGFLNWIKPKAGNYKLCRRMAIVIKRVLDQIFEPESEAQNQPVAVSMNDATLVDDWSMEGLNDLDWLHSIDWTQPPYMEFTQGTEVQSI